MKIVETCCDRASTLTLETVDIGTVVRLNNGKLYIVACLLEGRPGPFAGAFQKQSARRVLINLATGFARPIENGARTGCMKVEAELRVC